jgi:hypothetical protein
MLEMRSFVLFAVCREKISGRKTDESFAARREVPGGEIYE